MRPKLVLDSPECCAYILSMAGNEPAEGETVMDKNQKARALQAAAEIVSRLSCIEPGEPVDWLTIAAAQKLIAELGLEELNVKANAIDIAKSLRK